MKKINHLVLLLFISMMFISSLSHAQGPELHAGTWEVAFSKEMSDALDKLLKMLDAMAKTEASMHKPKDNLIDSLEEARKPRSFNLSEKQAVSGVISIFEQLGKATQDSGIKNINCKYKIEWLKKRIGIVSGKCNDGSIIKGEVSVPSDIQAHYKGTVTSVDDSAVPVGWDAKWTSPYNLETYDVY